MQIISGNFKGRKLICPKGVDTRPTLARVKESLFCQIADLIYGANILDLFAGSGALAAECISRGANKAVLVDQSNDAKIAIIKNLRNMNYDLLQLPAQHALFRLHNQGIKFNIVFLDPPYESDLGFLCLRLLKKLNLLADNAVVVYETTNKKQLPNIPKSYIIKSDRVYGLTRIIILELLNE